MRDVRKSVRTSQDIPLYKQRNYNEIVDYFDTAWHRHVDATPVRLKSLDNALGNPAEKFKSVVVTGTNGKSITTHLTEKLLHAEGLTVGALYVPHVLTYNERIVVHDKPIANKEFTDIANQVISTAESLNIEANSLELLTMMGFVYFAKNNVDVALLEIDAQHIAPLSMCKPSIVAVTRAIDEKLVDEDEVPLDLITKMLSIVGEGTYVVSADQSKLNLQTMLEMTAKQGGSWAMPIRKLAQLVYPFEQLHGRCAALAERIADIYVNSFVRHDTVVFTDTLLTKQKGQRGRPTLEAKRHAELNPKKTVDQFWRETCNSLPGRFQLLDKEKPTILLDNASNLDAIKNILLGVRLLHYQRPLKGLTVILGCNNSDINIDGLMRALRYFFKKTSGQVIVCPVDGMPSDVGAPSWDIEKVTNDLKTMKIKARACPSFKEAFDIAQKSVDERYGLVVITGSTAIINEYWNYKGIKKVI